MANDRLYIGNKIDKTYVFVENGWGTGWTGGHFDGDLIAKFLSEVWEDGNGGGPTCLEFFSEESESYMDYIKNGECLVTTDAGGFEYKSLWRS